MKSSGWISFSFVLFGSILGFLVAKIATPSGYRNLYKPNESDNSIAQTTTTNTHSQGEANIISKKAVFQKLNALGWFPEKKAQIRVLAADLAKENLANAIELAQSVNGSSYSDVVWFAILQQVANSSSYIEALDLCKTHKPALYSKLVKDWAANSPKEAMSFLKDVDHWRKQTFLLHTLQSWVERSPSQAVSWFASNSDRLSVYDRNNTLLWLITQHSEKQPSEAIDLANEHLNGEALESVVKSAIGNWGQNNQGEAVDWLKGIEDDRFRYRMTSEFISSLGAENLKLAESLLSTLPAKRMRIDAATKLTRAKVEEGIAATTEWIGTLSDPTVRSEAILTAAHTIAQTDPTEATSFVLSEKVANHVKRRFLSETVDSIFERSIEDGMSWFSALPVLYRDEVADQILSSRRNILQPSEIEILSDTR